MSSKLLKPVIPPSAREVVRERHPNGMRQIIEYRIGSQVVGGRCLDENGCVGMEFAIRDGRMHGPMRYLDPNGVMTYETRYVNGKQHGVAKQYDERGRLIGACRMRHGTGLDLWYYKNERGRVQLAEERQYKDGKLDGFEWWWLGRGIWKEGHFRQNKKHGIFREWNHAGRLRRGFPKYYVNDQQVDKRRYIRACLLDESLPKFAAAENRPYRRRPTTKSELLHQRKVR